MKRAAVIAITLPAPIVLGNPLAFAGGGGCMHYEGHHAVCEGRPGPPGPHGIFLTRSFDQEFELPATDYTVHTVHCPHDWTVTGGGYEFVEPPYVGLRGLIVESFPEQNEGWTVGVRNPFYYLGDHIRIYAVCAPTHL